VPKARGFLFVSDTWRPTHIDVYPISPQNWQTNLTREFMAREATEKLIRDYYDAFHRKDFEGFLALLHDDVAHDINQGGRETGKEAFREFLDHMNQCYDEMLTDITVMTNEDGSRAAAEFIVHGTYLATDNGFPEARGQKYTLPAGAFFEIVDGKVARISNNYNVADWLKQIV
jgi:steroid delta-isomerase-like uncharacterized protein